MTAKFLTKKLDRREFLKSRHGRAGLVLASWHRFSQSRRLHACYDGDEDISFMASTKQGYTQPMQ